MTARAWSPASPRPGPELTVVIGVAVDAGPAQVTQQRSTKKKIIAGVAGGALALGAVGMALPAVAAGETSTSTSTSSTTSKLQRLKDALAGLVSDGTLTQDQADKVATTLDQKGLGGGDRGKGGGRGGMDLQAAATALDITPDQLRTELQADGATLASVAKSHGVSVDTLVAALVKAQQAHFAEEVSKGDLTQAEADQRSADLQTRITERVNSTEPIGKDGGAGRGPGDGRGGDGTGGTRSGAPTSTPASSASSGS